MCGIDADGKGYHIWTFAGDPDVLPIKGDKCDCGLVAYKEQDTLIPHQEEG